MIYQKPRRSFAIRFFGFPGIALLLAAFAVPQAKAETANLSGFWMGTGMVLLSNSGPEPAKCRAQFFQNGPDLAVQAQCATPSGSTEQAARLREVAANTYAGTFFNPEFKIAGTIQITVRDNRQYVTLWSEAGTASLTFWR